MAKSKTLSHLEWVRLACGKDQARPVLTGVSVQHELSTEGEWIGGEIAACDGHRLHFAPSEDTVFATGLVDPASGRKIDGTFPNYRYVTPSGEPTHHLTDTTELAAICAASIAHCRIIRGALPYIYIKSKSKNIWTVFNGVYLLDALKGFVGPRPTGFYQESSLTPAKITDGVRTAVIMPRVAPPNPRAPYYRRVEMFRIDHLIAPLDAAWAEVAA